ncbi:MULTISPECIES: AI-2E family transporter [Alishewanella]|uniref:Permease n=1 Tax=Alishewanella jeotgali KCTC 22429 TaxID=1129374 RepID=H3Z9Y9_9ALTE|nr:MULTISPECIES: AI-2E family transporter [Alishewanella]EHR42663.1 permease [Alishewanella jeotgali KCTC 22429]OCW98273.1 AI-2E family transporter [Alishewanella sp. HH-ZS]
MPAKFTIESRHYLLILALLLALYGSYLLVAPYLGAIVLAFVLSLLCYPVHHWIGSKMPTKPNLAATLSCLLLVLVILVPASLVFAALVQQGLLVTKQIYLWLGQGGAEQLLQHPYLQQLQALAADKLPGDLLTPRQIIERLSEFAAGFSKELLNLSTKMLGDLTGLLFSFVLMLFVLYFLLRDHDKIVAAIQHYIPLSRSQKDALLSEAKLVARSAVLGSVLTAIAQGLAGGIAMAIVGFPGLFWGTMMAFASFIPAVGTALIWLPASLYLFFTGDWGWGLFLAGWGVLVVGSIDNVLRPILMQGSSNMSTLLIFLALLGGIQLFGLIGVIYGPIIFALTLVLLRLYTIEFKDFLAQQDKS